MKEEIYQLARLLHDHKREENIVTPEDVLNASQIFLDTLLGHAWNLNYTEKQAEQIGKRVRRVIINSFGFKPEDYMPDFVKLKNRR